MNWTQWNFPTELSYAGIDKMSLVCVHLLKSEGFGTCNSNSGKHSLSPSFMLLNFLRVLINKVSKKSSHSLLAPLMDFHQKGGQLLASFWSSVYWLQYLIWIWNLFFFPQDFCNYKFLARQLNFLKFYTELVSLQWCPLFGEKLGTFTLTLSWATTKNPPS